MKKCILIIALLALLPAAASAQNIHVLLYCDGEAPTTVDGTPVSWKAIIPKIDGTVLTDFVVLATSGTKRLFYCLFNTADPRYETVKAWVIKNKDTLGLKWWVGGSAREAWKAVFLDRQTDAVAAAIINNLIKYPVTVVDGETGQNITKFVPVKDVASYGQTVVWSYYATANIDAILPHKFFDGSK